MRYWQTMRLTRILLIHGWAAWTGYGCYMMLTGHVVVSPRWWLISLISLIVATATYMFFNGVEAT